MANIQILRQLLFVLQVLCLPGFSYQQKVPISFGNVPLFGTTSPNARQESRKPVRRNGGKVSSPCNYLLSQGTNGNCVVTTVDVERRMDAIKDDITRARLQDVAQNSILQRQLTQIKDDDIKMALLLDGLKRDVLSLRARGSSGPATSNGVSNLGLQQVQTVLLRNISAVDKRVSNLAQTYQRDAVSQAQTNSVLQTQISQLLQENVQLRLDNGKLTQGFQSLQQDMQTLTTQVRALAASCIGCGGSGSTISAPTTTIPVTPAVPTISPNIIAQLQQNISTVAKSLQTANQRIQKLSTDQITTNATLRNHTLRLGNNLVQIRSVDARLSNLEQNYTGVYSLLGTLNNRVKNDATRINQLTNTAQVLQQSVNDLRNSSILTQFEISRLSNDVATLTQSQARLPTAILQLEDGLNNVIGSLNPQVTPQLNQLRQNVQATLTSNPVVRPPRLTTKSSLPMPPTLFPRPG